MFDLSAQATTDLKRLLAADYMHPHPHAQRHHQQHLRQYHPYDQEKRETKSRRQCHADAADGGEESWSGCSARSDGCSARSDGCSARSDGCSASRTAVEAMRRLSLGCSKTT